MGDKPTGRIILRISSTLNRIISSGVEALLKSKGVILLTRTSVLCAESKTAILYINTNDGGTIVVDEKGNEKTIKSALEKSGYKTRHNAKKMFYSLGPFADITHANNEVKKLKKIHSISSKVVDFVF